MAILHEKPDNPVLAQDHTNRGKLLYRDERFEDALEESKLALQIRPQLCRCSRPSDPGLAEAAALRRGDPRRATSPSRRARNLPCSTSSAALAHAAHHDYPGAIRDYGRALEIRPNDGRLLAHRGWAYLVFDSPKLALADFEAAIKLDPANADAYNGRGTARARLGDHAAAVADAREALRHGRTNPRVTYNAARIYALAAAIAAAEVGEKGRQARPLVFQVPGYRRAVDPGGVRTGSARETRGVLAGYGPARPGLEGDPAAAQVRGFDRDQQVAEARERTESFAASHQPRDYCRCSTAGRSESPRRLLPSRREELSLAARGSWSWGTIWLEERVLLSGAATLAAHVAHRMNSAVPIAIGSAGVGQSRQGGADFYEIAPSSDGRLIAQTHAVSAGLQLRLSIYDGQGNLLVQSDGQSSGRLDPLIDQHVAAGDRLPRGAEPRPAREPTRFRRH